MWKHPGQLQAKLEICTLLFGVFLDLLLYPHSCASSGGTSDSGSIPGSERSPGGGNDNPQQSSCLENSMTEEPGGLQSMGSQNSQTGLSMHALLPL